MGSSPIQQPEYTNPNNETPMHSALVKFARQYLLDALNKLPEDHHRIFKMMYGRKGGKRLLEDAEAMSLKAVIAEIHEDKLSWAMTQVETSVRELDKNLLAAESQ